MPIQPQSVSLYDGAQKIAGGLNDGLWIIAVHLGCCAEMALIKGLDRESTRCGDHWEESSDSKQYVRMDLTLAMGESDTRVQECCMRVCTDLKTELLVMFQIGPC